MPTTNPRVDKFIKDSPVWSQPILKRLRASVHKACPQIQETIKWGKPSFEYNGPCCLMAAFKAHCAFVFWKAKLMENAGGRLETKNRTAMGNLGRITSLKDLPSSATLVAMVKEAVNLNEAGKRLPRVVKTKPALKPPAYFMAAVRKSPKALATWKRFTPSCQREYVEWVTEAKQDSTRTRRLQTTVEWLAAGKQRNWKYQNC
jgi:uncharacterized protein YdeI (YjbR/CyaY-like superfamily)